jgi:hypothetical protein
LGFFIEKIGHPQSDCGGSIGSSSEHDGATHFAEISGKIFTRV